MVPEPAGSSLYLQETAINSYSEPNGSTLYPPASLHKIHSDPILPTLSYLITGIPHLALLIGSRKTEH
jgi:hypothetical protein